MLQKLKQFFTENIVVETQDETEDVRRRLAVATGALLLEMAYADDDFSDMEKSKIVTFLSKDFKLNEQETRNLVELAEMERKESLDLWQFTNLINRNYTNDQKAQVVEILWRVIYADGKVDKYEEALIRKLTYLLNLDHSVMIETKFRAREHAADKGEE